MMHPRDRWLRALKIATGKVKLAVARTNWNIEGKDALVFPMYESNTLYTKRCKEWDSIGGCCMRVANWISPGSKYHQCGSRYFCDRHRRSDSVEITDAMLRGSVRDHNCHITASETEVLI